jgi:hypothetical protein
MRQIIALATLAMLAGGMVPGITHAQEKEKRSEAENKAIAEIRKLGGSVMELAQNDNRLVVAYHLTDGKVTDKHLAPLKDLKSIVELNLRGTEISDDGLKQISGLATLERLHLEKTKIGDKGLAHLKGLSNLEYLNVFGTQVTDVGVDSILPALKKLKKLYIWQSKVTIDGVRKLKKAAPMLSVVPDLVTEAEKEARRKAEEERRKKPVEAKKPG